MHYQYHGGHDGRGHAAYPIGHGPRAAPARPPDGGRLAASMNAQTPKPSMMPVIPPSHIRPQTPTRGPSKMCQLPPAWGRSRIWPASSASKGLRGLLWHLHRALRAAYNDSSRWPHDGSAAVSARQNHAPSLCGHVRWPIPCRIAPGNAPKGIGKGPQYCAHARAATTPKRPDTSGRFVPGTRPNSINRNPW